MPKKNVKGPKRQRVVFSVYAPDANSVCLMGDFNGWDEKKHPMRKNENGIWEKTTMLFPGTYEYKFIVDGKWQTDPESDQACLNCFGTHNNIMIVREK